MGQKYIYFLSKVYILFFLSLVCIIFVEINPKKTKQTLFGEFMKKRYFLVVAMLTVALTTIAQVTRLNQTTAQVKLENGNIMYVDFYGPKVFRLFLDPKGGILRDPVAKPEASILVQNPRREAYIEVEGNEIRCASVCLSVDTKTGEITVNRPTAGLKISAPEFTGKKTLISVSRQKNEYNFGGGVQNGRFSHAGKIIAIENTNNWVDGGVASPTPFYWSTAGYGVMAYTFRPGKYDFGATDSEKNILYHETDYLDYFFMFGNGDVLDRFFQLTGNPVLLPKFAFYQGHLNAYNRDYWTPAENGFMLYEDGKRYNESQKDNGGVKESLNGESDNYQFSARAAIDRYIDNDMPLGWFLPNDGYGAGYGQTKTLDGNIQNLKEFGEYAKSKGVEIGLWTQSDLHPKEGIEALLQRDIVKEVRDAGVRVLKTDVAWVGAGYSFGLNGVADVAQIMPYYGNDARPFIISLDGWAGTQRYAGIWTGDQTGGDWEYIRFHIPTYIGSSLSGQPNISSDMDGIFGGKNLPVNVRDFQWKTFTPMQLNMDGWGSNPKYPQALGEPATSINRWYLKLKSHLMPYTYSIAHDAVKSGAIVWPMFYVEENPYTLGVRTRYQFMYGPSFLVAPIYKETRADAEGNDVRDEIYLPGNSWWYDYFTGQMYEGGRIINDYAAPLWKLPVFVKAGAIVPTHKPTNNPNEMDPHLRCYDFYPIDGINDFMEYDDDGKTQAYLHGRNAYTRLEQEYNIKNDQKLKIVVKPTVGGFEGFEPNKTTQLRIYLEQMPKKFTLKVNGKKVVLIPVNTYHDFTTTPNSYYFGKSDMQYMDITALMVNVGELDVTASEIVLEAKDVKLDFTNQLLQKHGALTLGSVNVQQVNAYDVTLQWPELQNADYYEIMFDGQLYSEIRQKQYVIDNLSPETDYTFKVRAVNADGKSEWQTLSATTASDPLEFAIRGMKGETSCENQGGQGINRMFDFDEGNTWHTSWSSNAVPFDVIVDMKSVNTLDKMWYLPRPDAANGTLLEGTISYGMDRKQWSEPMTFQWARNNEIKEVMFPEHPTARYVRLHVTKAVGNFGSGQELYIFRQPGTEYYIPGDINKDGRLDENDLTSYMNYTGLRQGDGDFEGYISNGDLNKNGLIDAYDISAVAIELENGVSSRKVEPVAGSITTSVKSVTTKEGDELLLTVHGKGLRSVNALSFCIFYDPAQCEYLGVEAGEGIKQMYNMTYDRLHTNGQKALYPTFVNLGEQKYLEGDGDVMTIRFRSKHAGKVGFQMKDGLLVDKYMNSVAF